MSKPKSARKSSKKDVKMAAANDVAFVERLTPEEIIKNDDQAAPVVAETPAPVEAPVSARTAAIRRSQAGKFNKVVLSQIGGVECPRFYPMTWAERDKFMGGDSEAAKVVKARYEAHLATLKS